MVDPATITLEDARKLVARRYPPDIAASLAYLRGDLWQKGDGWRGPKPPSSHPDHGPIIREIERSLAGPNYVRALIRRHVAGVLGREPQWDLSVFTEPEAEAKEEAEEAPPPPPAEGDVAQPPEAAEEPDEEPPPVNPESEALTMWWDRVVLASPEDDDERSPIAGGVLGLALARGLCGDVPVLRLRDTGDRTAPPPATLDEALDRIVVEVLPATRAAVLPDLDEGPLAVALLTGNARSLKVKLRKEAPKEVAEIVTLDADGGTLIAVGQDTSEPIPLGGRLTMAALRVPSLITPNLLGIQRQAVKTMTVMGRNTDTAGFAETTYLNADRPGRYITDPTAPDGKRFVPDPIKSGPAVRNFFYGVQDEKTGNYATPSIHERDPVSPSTFLETLGGLRAAAHEEAHQLHALIAGDATPSGESRRQAAADFLASLGPSAQAVEAVTRWLLETAYALALALMGDEAPEDLRATVTCQLSGTLPTVEELKETREAVSGKLLSRATYQTAAGVADVEAEDEAIEKERAANPPPPQLVVANPTTTPVNAQPGAAGAANVQETR